MKLRYLAIFVMVALLVLAAGCGKKAAPAEPAAPAPAAPAPAAPAEEAPAQEAPAEAAAAAEEVVLEEGGDVTAAVMEEKESTGLAMDVSAENEAFPQAACELKSLDGKERRVITVKIKNVGTDEWVVRGKENPKGKVIISNRGVVDIMPECEKSILAAGESTLCTGVDMGAPMPGKNRVTVNTPDQLYARVVECP